MQPENSSCGDHFVPRKFIHWGEKERSSGCCFCDIMKYFLSVTVHDMQMPALEL